MELSQEIRKRLGWGEPVAAEIAAPSGMSAFVVVIPQIPPEQRLEMRNAIGVFPVRRKPTSIIGYEVRYLLHDAKYTDTDWGMDYDLVLADKTTRVKRLFVERQEAISAAISPWLVDLSWLRSAEEFDSSLVNSPIEIYLERPDQLPHLWGE